MTCVRRQTLNCPDQAITLKPPVAGSMSAIAMLHKPWSGDVFSLEVNHPIFEVRYSCRKLSTGCSWAARIAGTVPNKSPTSALAAIAMIADVPEIGIR
jgi:hypothetical protein